jgi:hypothetical protein
MFDAVADRAQQLALLEFEFDDFPALVRNVPYLEVFATNVMELKAGLLSAPTTP